MLIINHDFDECSLFQLGRPPVGGKTDSDPCRAEERKLFVGMLRQGEQRIAKSEQQQRKANSKQHTAKNLDNAIKNSR
jgi:hypothetical protein